MVKLPDLKFEEEIPDLKFEEEIPELKFEKEYKPLFEFVSPEQHPLLETIQEAGAAGGKFLSTLGFGIPEYALKRFAGREIPTPPSRAGKVLTGLGQLGAFIRSPLRVAGKVAPHLPGVGRAFAPAATKAQAVIKPLLRGATTLGTASAIMTPEEGLFAPSARVKAFFGGAMHGAVLGAIGFTPTKAVRMMTASAYMGLPATLREEPIEQQIFSYGLGAWIGRKGMTPKQLLAKEKPLAMMIRDGTDKPQEFLSEAKSILDTERNIAAAAGKDPISRQGRFNQILSRTMTQSTLKLAERVLTRQPPPDKKILVKGIKRRTVELLRDPKFMLEDGDADFLANYIKTDLKFRSGDLMKMDLGQLQSLSDYLHNYQIPDVSPFLKTPPLKPQFAGRDWRLKINPWDITLRGGLRKLHKLGFGEEMQEGLTGKFVVGASIREETMGRYLSLRNNWMRVTGMNKKRAEDMFGYLDGKVHGDYLKKIHGEKTLQVANQMREYLDTLILHINRHKAMYGEEPIKPRKDYITHIFEDFLQEIIAKKHPFPDWLEEVMPYIVPKAKGHPYLKARKGMPGYQQDIWKALDAYTHRTASTIADEPIRRAYKVSRYIGKQMDYERQTGDISQTDLAGIKKQLDNYTKHLQGRPGAIDKYIKGITDIPNAILARLPGSPQIKSLNELTDGLSSLIYGSQMAFRPKLPIRNLGQHSLIIGQTGFKPLGWAIKNRNTPEARKILENSAILKTRGKYFGAESQAMMREGMLRGITRLGMGMFRKADLINVEDAFLAGYKHAKLQGKTDIEAYKRGDQVAALTQYIYLPENRSDLAKAWGLSQNLGRPLSVFTTWPANYIEFNIASASNPDTRANLLKYYVTALTITALTAPLGIRGAEYVGITSPLALLQMVRGRLPVVGIAEKPKIQIIRELKRFFEGEDDLVDLLFYTFRE